MKVYNQLKHKHNKSPPNIIKKNVMNTPANEVPQHIDMKVAIMQNAEKIIFIT